MPLRNGGFVFYVDVWAFFNRSAVGLFALRNISQLVRRRTMCVSTSVVILKQHRTIPALRLKHRSGSCGTASALPKFSIMSGCGTRIVLRGQKLLALCDRCPCFGSLFPPLAALTFAASSIICAFGLASAAPRSPYRHLELCGIALKNICRGRCSASSHTQGLAGIISSPPKDCKQKPAPFQEPVNI